MRSNKATLSIRIRRIRNRILRSKHLVWRIKHDIKRIEKEIERNEQLRRCMAMGYLYAGPTRYPRPLENGIMRGPDEYAQGY